MVTAPLVPRMSNPIRPARTARVIGSTDARWRSGWPLPGIVRLLALATRLGGLPQAEPFAIVPHSSRQLRNDSVANRVKRKWLHSQGLPIQYRKIGGWSCDP